MSRSLFLLTLILNVHWIRSKSIKENIINQLASSNKEYSSTGKANFLSCFQKMLQDVIQLLLSNTFFQITINFCELLPNKIKMQQNMGSCYRNWQKNESTLPHTYVLNKFLTADRSCTTKYSIVEKTLIKVGSSYLYASFGTCCVQIGKFFKSQ